MKAVKHKFLDACLEGDNLWYVDGKRMVLCRIDLLTQKVYFEALLKTKLTFYPKKMLVFKKDMVIASENLPEIVIYERTIRRTFSFQSNAKWKLNRWGKGVRDCIQVNHRLFFIPIFVHNPIVVFDMEFRKFEYFDIQLAEGNEIINDVKFVNDYMLLLVDNHIFCKVNVQNGNMKKYVFDNNYRFGSFLFAGTCYWFRSCNGFTVYKVTENFDDFVEVILEGESGLEHGETEGRLLSVSNGVLLLPVMTETITIIDEKKLVQERIETSTLGRTKEGLKGTFAIGSIMWNEYLLLFPWSSKEMVFIDLQEKRAYNKMVYMDKTEERRWEELMLERTLCTQEKEVYQLSDYINTIRNCNSTLRD